MKKIIPFLLLILIFSSCLKYGEPKLLSLSGEYRIDKITYENFDNSSYNQVFYPGDLYVNPSETNAIVNVVAPFLRKKVIRRSSFHSSSSCSARSLYAVKIKKAPKMKNAPENFSKIALPAAMKPPRSTSAMMIPNSNTSCCLVFSTCRRLKMITKTKMLSTDNAYSVNHPAKNSFCAFGSDVQLGMK